jgi:hypothetical protein
MRLTTVRLVKFLYLADFYHARWYHGETFTKMPWAFVNYGPYCHEALRYIDYASSRAIINEQVYQSDFPNRKDFNLYSCTTSDINEIEKDFPASMMSELKYAIKKYGDDTAALLDYVYFETDPMKEVKKGDILDFSEVGQPQFSKSENIRKLSKKDIEFARNKIKHLGEKFNQGRERLRQEERELSKLKDESYLRALEYFDEGELEVGLKGTAKIID